jgi:hypothetical protein
MVIEALALVVGHDKQGPLEHLGPGTQRLVDVRDEHLGAGEVGVARYKVVVGRVGD